MDAARDARFLARLVQRGHVELAAARGLDAGLRAGEALDGLLARHLGWSAESIARARRTEAGEQPEVPGFEIARKLGSGGTSDVFEGRDRGSGARYALKILSPVAAQSPATLKAFVAEARRLAELEHPAVVKGHGVRKFPGFAPGSWNYFTVLELVDGATLLERLDAGESFDEDALLSITGAVAEALGYLASRGVVHRDVKPGNIMLDRAGAVKLIDLGFAAEKDERAAQGSAAGTKEYLAPEQALGGGAADLRSDVYSLGATLFHLLVGRLPFEATDDQELLRQHVMASLSSSEIKSRDVSPHLHYLIERMMSKDPAHRFQSWEELRRDIAETRATIAKLRALDEGPDAPTRRGPPRRRKF